MGKILSNGSRQHMVLTDQAYRLFWVFWTKQCCNSQSG